MKVLVLLLCLSGLAAVCLGSTTVAAGTTPTSVPATPPVTTTTAAGAATAVAGATTAASGATNPAVTNAGGSGTAATAAGSGTAATAAARITCLSCTGNETDECGSGVSTSTTTCSGSCWAYHKENTTTNVITFIRGCGETGDTCTDANMDENCNTVGGTKTCRRCCTANSCNGASFELDGVAGSGTADVHVSVVVTMASALFAILALW